ncbi:MULTISPECIES: phosphatidate cytidylyltransferase [unclassified Iodidimonas]|uniref:phosphatidate cytidylyltransferase n=1 Tax=unclassified Iodidimonas TaxID=2626145 RepID=UPI002482B51C|nr:MULTISPECIES: phosphatidate cytidylyltransferase [unclassified Iodidimonas]
MADKRAEQGPDENADGDDPLSDVVHIQPTPSQLMTRVSSALILIPLALSAVWLGGIWFAGLLALVGAVMSVEWAMIAGFNRRLLGVFYGFTTLLVAGFILLSSEKLSADLALNSFASLADWGLFTACAGGVLLLLSFISDRFAPLKWGGLAIFYCWTPLYALMWLRAQDGGLWLVAWVLLVVWGTDIGGYFVGRAIGGAKLVPKISPNKTWSGLFGGMALAALAGLIGALWFHFGSVFYLALAAAGLAVIGQIGDLAESALKRHFNVKDSGRIIPGHGGVLDRVDGLVFVAPLVALFLYFAR